MRKRGPPPKCAVCHKRFGSYCRWLSGFMCRKCGRRLFRRQARLTLWRILTFRVPMPWRTWFRLLRVGIRGWVRGR